MNIKPSIIPFTTIEIGNELQIGPDFIKALDKKGSHYSFFGGKILDSQEFITEKNPRTVKLAKITPRDLHIIGNERIHDMDIILKQAKEFGLEICPAEAGIQFFLQSKDKPCALFGMKPINNQVFEISRTGSCYEDSDDPTGLIPRRLISRGGAPLLLMKTLWSGISYDTEIIFVIAD